MKILITVLSLFFALSVFGQQKMSDLEVDGLKGKVKSVTTTVKKIESKNFADNTLKTYRDSVEIYDTNGTQTEIVYYEQNSKNTYTIIDGDLTLKFSQLEKRPKNRLSADTLGGSQEPKPTQPKDERYDLKYKFKFDNAGRRIESLQYGNTGILVGKITYKYDKKGLLVEELRYMEGNILNEQYFNKYDAINNLIESKLVLHRPDKNIISYWKYSNYKLDTQANWTERTVTSLGEFQGKELKTISIHFRKIEYYQ